MAESGRMVLLNNAVAYQMADAAGSLQKSVLCERGTLAERDMNVTRIAKGVTHE
jgi:hypothetical protein